MTAITIAICSDSILERSSLYEMLVRYCTDHSIETGIDLFDSGQDFLDSSPSGRYAVILIKSAMKDRDDQDVIAKLRETDPDAIVIFYAASPELTAGRHPVKADFLLTKPVTWPAFSEVLDSCHELLSEYSKTITVISDRLPVHIPHRSIIYIEVVNSMCAIHTATDIIQTWRPLGELEQELSSPLFLRCHRSYLLNMNYVEVPLECDFRMKDGTLIPISKKNKTRIRQTYFQYLWKK